MLTTVEKILAIDKSLTEEEKPLLEHFIKVATSKIEEYCNRKFEKSDFKDFIEGPISHYNFKNYPVISTTFTDYKRLDKERGIIYFNSTQCNVGIDYTAGYEADEIPPDLELAVLMYYKSFVENGEFKDFAKISERLGDHQVNYGVTLLEKMFNNTVPNVVASLVSGYRGRI